MPVTVELSMKRALSASARVRDREAQVRRSFVRKVDGQQPPMATLLRGGRGGEVRLKLLLTMLWIAAKPPHDTSFPARAWAELLGLADPETNGARRVADAIRSLEASGLVEVQHRPGSPARVFLLRENGSGQAYEVPGAIDVAVGERLDESDWYFRLSPQMWTKGWVASLSAAGVASYLVVRDLEQLEEHSEVWLSGKLRGDRYGISVDTWSKGIRELVEHDVVRRRRVPIGDDFDWRRLRNAYRVNDERLADPPLFEPSTGKRAR